MCYAVGSIDQATGTCPMCKVFKPSGRCPHIKETCRNRALHPRCDVVYLKNAEVQTFNGCGFCKWARNNTNPKLSGIHNPGWPGCCRSPNPAEHKLIQAADWPTVSLVHRVAIPVEIKAILESITGQRSSGATALAFSTGSIRGNPLASQPPSLSRRSTSSSVALPSRGDATPVKAVTVTVPQKTRSGSGGSPQQIPTSLNSGSRNNTGDDTPSSLPNSSAMDQVQNMLRRPLVDTQEKRRDHSREAKKGSPNRKSVELLPSRKSSDVPASRKSIDLTGSISRRSTSSQQRPSITAVAAITSVNKVTVDSPVSYHYANPSPTVSPSTRVSGDRERRDSGDREKRDSGDRERRDSADREKRDLGDREKRDTGDREKRDIDSIRRRKVSVESTMEEMSISSGSSASSSDSGEGSETTVVSDGAFTDYLSDESDAELQRQAEIKAALLAQSHMEEQEFKAARQQLANIDLRPPKSWNSQINSTPRAQNAVPNNLGTTYSPQLYGSSPYIAASSGPHPRV